MLNSGEVTSFKTIFYLKKIYWIGFNIKKVNGLPGHANSFYINDLLKGELKFDGFVVSDWEDVKRIYTRDKLASSEEEAVRISIMSGLDMSMVPYDESFYLHCVNLSRKGDQKFLDRITDAAKRILKVKNDLGLLDGYETIYPLTDDLKKIGTKESEDINLNAARESIILAKNDLYTLPLEKNLSNKKILVTGPTGNLRKVRP